MADSKGRLVIGSELSELERLLAFIEGFCRKASVSDSIKYKLFLVVEELAVNSITHGYRGTSGGRIEIELARISNRIEITLEDEAPPFNPLSDDTPVDVDSTLDERQVGGLGVHFVRMLTESAEYQHVNGRNVVRAAFSEVA